MKRILIMIIALTVAASAASLQHFTGVAASAEKVSAENTALSSAKAAYLVDYNSGTLLFAKNENAKLPIASMCKVMTLLLIFEELDAGRLSLDEDINISSEASGMGGSQAFLENGGRYKCEELLRSIVMASANDACVAFAERICGSEADFTERMNARAAELNMRNTLFANCTGLPRPTQYSSAADVAAMFRALISHKGYFELSKTWMHDLVHSGGRVTGLTNTNKLIKRYEGCDGGKTGFTNEAGHCLTATAKRGNMRLISVVIGAENSDTRFKEVTAMFNYGFSGFTNKTVLDSSMPMDLTVNVERGKTASVNIIPARNSYLFSKRNTKENIRVDFEPSDRLKAPIARGDEVGTLVVYRNDVEEDRVAALSVSSVERKCYFDYIKDVFSCWKI